MSRVASPAKPPAYYFFVLLSGAVIVVGFDARAAHAKDVDAPPSHSWCIARGDLPPDCVHHDFLACNISAFLTGGACVKVEPSLIPAATVDATPARQKRKMAPRQLPAAEHDKLFREFVRWKRTATK